jgi:hypothetical protein
LGNKKKLISSSKQNELKSTLKKPQLEESLRQDKKSSREKNEIFKNESTPKQHHREAESAGKLAAGDRDDSLERIELKW